MFHWIIWKVKLMFVRVPYKKIQPQRERVSSQVQKKSVKEEETKELKVIVVDH